MKCASDGQCKRSIYMCSLTASSTKPVPALTQFCSQFTCADGSCRSDFCPEWLTCGPNQVQCPTGPCVSDLKLCPLDSNGCPWDKPVFCNFTATCVATPSKCLASNIARTNLNSQCKTNFPSQPSGCRLGNCVTNTTRECTANFTT